MLNASSIYRTSSSLSSSFPSRRSVVHSRHGIVACTQPLAAAVGQRILREGGNAADAAVAVAAALNVTEPGSTGIGGDMFCLYYDAQTRRVHALNGSGRSPAAISLEAVRKRLGARSAIPITDVCAVTVPGAAAGWVDAVDRFGSGKLSLMQILRPAIELAEEGCPVSEITAWMWQNSEDIIRNGSPHTCQDYLVQDPKAKDGLRAPQAGENFKNPHLARTFRLLAEEGKKGFYQGRIAESIVQAVQDRGGFLSLEDLQFHLEKGSQEVDALSLTFDARHLLRQQEQQEGGYMPETVRLWEHPPNGQGIVALMALGVMQQLARTDRIRPFSRTDDHNSVEYLHAVIESLRIAFADAKWWVTDPDVQDKLPPTHLVLSESYLTERAQLFSPDRKATNLRPLDHNNKFKGRSPAHNRCDTAYFAVTDRCGNGISFINSLYGNFGTGIIPPETGFILQARGASFSLDPAHPNVVAPRKRPYHTIIPALTTVPIAKSDDTDELGSDEVLHSVYGVMGGFMQPQGHVQVLLNQLLFGHTPQGALDAPRICVGGWIPGAATSEEDCDTVFLEEGIPEHVAAGLRQLGHRVHFVHGWGQREMFGRGQLIRCHYDADGRVVYSAGSDPRGDGGAFPV